MQIQGVDTDGVAVQLGSFICAQATELVGLSEQISASVTAYVTAHPEAALLDLDLAGGGMGGVLIATLIVTPTSDVEVETPLDALTFNFFQASDAQTLQTKLNEFLLTLGNSDAIWAWDVTSMGAGATWVACLATYTPGGG